VHKPESAVKLFSQSICSVHSNERERYWFLFYVAVTGPSLWFPLQRLREITYVKRFRICVLCSVICFYFAFTVFLLCAIPLMVFLTLLLTTIHILQEALYKFCQLIDLLIEIVWKACRVLKLVSMMFWQWWCHQYICCHSARIRSSLSCWVSTASYFLVLMWHMDCWKEAGSGKHC